MTTVLVMPKRQEWPYIATKEVSSDAVSEQFDKENKGLNRVRIVHLALFSLICIVYVPTDYTMGHSNRDLVFLSGLKGEPSLAAHQVLEMVLSPLRPASPHTSHRML